MKFSFVLVASKAISSSLCTRHDNGQCPGCGKPGRWAIDTLSNEGEIAYLQAYIVVSFAHMTQHKKKLISKLTPFYK